MAQQGPLGNTVPPLPPQPHQLPTVSLLRVWLGLLSLSFLASALSLLIQPEEHVESLLACERISTVHRLFGCPGAFWCGTRSASKLNAGEGLLAVHLVRSLGKSHLVVGALTLSSALKDSSQALHVAGALATAMWSSLQLLPSLEMQFLSQAEAAQRRTYHAFAIAVSLTLCARSLYHSFTR